MSDPILCPECGHDIDNHDLGECYDCSGMLPCDRTPSDIAHAYGEERVREALTAEPSDAEIDAATDGLSWYEPGDWGATRNALKAALKVRADQ